MERIWSLSLNTGRFHNVVKWADIVLIIATGALFSVLVWDIIDFMAKPQEYEHLIGKGSPFGCNYQSANSYLLIATVSTIFAGVAFGVGFIFKNKIWSVSSRVMTILLMYIFNFIVARFLC